MADTTLTTEIESLAQSPKAAQASPHATRPEDKIPFVQKISWSAGGITDQFMANGIGTLAQLIYNIGLGVPVVWIGWATTIPRIFDAFIDPFIGNSTDNARTRWGRRRPFIFVGAFLCAFFFAAVWMPPTKLSMMGLAVFFTLASMLYYFAYAIFIIPQNALGIELTPDYHERTRIQAWKLFMGSIGAIALGWMYPLAQNAFFCGSEHTSVPKEIVGMRPLAIIAAFVILGSGLLSALFCKEKMEVQSQPKIKVAGAIWLTLKNGPFLILTAVIFNLLIGLFIVMPFTNYISIYYVCKGDKAFGGQMGALTNTIYNILGMVAIPVVTWLATRWGKRKTMIVGQLSVIVGSVSSLWLFTPAHPYWQIIPPVAMCPGLTCVWILCSSMLAEVCDVDELKSGLRREGMFGAVFALVFKAGLAAVGVLSAYMLKWSGLVDGALMQPPRTLFILRYEFALIPAFFLAISTLLTWCFPITEKSARAVRAQLDARKQATGTSAAQAS